MVARKCKIYQLTYEAVLHLFSGRGKIINIPLNSQIVAVHENYQRHCFDLIISNDDFPPTTEGTELERVECELDRVDEYLWRGSYITQFANIEIEEAVLGKREEYHENPYSCLSNPTMSM